MYLVLNFNDGSKSFLYDKEDKDIDLKFPFNCKIYSDFIRFSEETDQIIDDKIEWTHKKYSVKYVDLILNEYFDYYDDIDNYKYREKHDFFEYLDFINYEIPLQIKDYTTFIKFILYHFVLRSVEYEGVIYYNQPNQYYDEILDPNHNVRDDNPFNNKVCTGKYECELDNRINIDSINESDKKDLSDKEDSSDEDDNESNNESDEDESDEEDESNEEYRNNNKVIYNITYYSYEDRLKDEFIDFMEDLSNYDIEDLDDIYSTEYESDIRIFQYEKHVKNVKETLKYIEKLKESLYDGINNEKLQKIILFRNKEICMINGRHSNNHDHRGSDHTHIILKKYDKVYLGQNQTEITLYDFVVAILKNKYNKFNRWYELYTESNYYNNDIDTKHLISSYNKIYLYNRFDYGS
jgi:hypothetical protein